MHVNDILKLVAKLDEMKKNNEDPEAIENFQDDIANLQMNHILGELLDNEVPTKEKI